jgi:hypothetical protein
MGGGGGEEVVRPFIDEGLWFMVYGLGLRSKGLGVRVRV